MATKVIRLQDSNDNILIPVTNASYVQMTDLEGNVNSVAEAIIKNKDIIDKHETRIIDLATVVNGKQDKLVAGDDATRLNGAKLSTKQIFTGRIDTIAGAVPTSLSVGGCIYNSADKKLYIGDSNSQPVEVAKPNDFLFFSLSGKLYHYQFGNFGEVETGGTTLVAGDGATRIIDDNLETKQIYKGTVINTNGVPQGLPVGAYCFNTATKTLYVGAQRDNELVTDTVPMPDDFLFIDTASGTTYRCDGTTLNNIANIKTINGQSLLGGGNVQLTGEDMLLEHGAGETINEKVNSNTTDITALGNRISALEGDEDVFQGTAGDASAIPPSFKGYWLGTNDVYRVYKCSGINGEYVPVNTIGTFLFYDTPTGDWYIVDTGKSTTKVHNSTQVITDTSKATSSNVLYLVADSSKNVSGVVYNSKTYTFAAEKGEKGDKGDTGATGVGITSVKQTVASMISGDTNVVEITTSDGKTSQVKIRNGNASTSGTEIVQTTGTATDKVMSQKSVTDALDFPRVTLKVTFLTEVIKGKQMNRNGNLDNNATHCTTCHIPCEGAHKVELLSGDPKDWNYIIAFDKDNNVVANTVAYNNQKKYALTTPATTTYVVATYLADTDNDRGVWIDGVKVHEPVPDDIEIKHEGGDKEYYLMSQKGVQDYVNQRLMDSAQSHSSFGSGFCYRLNARQIELLEASDVITLEICGQRNGGLNGYNNTAAMQYFRIMFGNNHAEFSTTNDGAYAFTGDNKLNPLSGSAWQLAATQTGVEPRMPNDRVLMVIDRKQGIVRLYDKCSRKIIECQRDAYKCDSWLQGDDWLAIVNYVSNNQDIWALRIYDRDVTVLQYDNIFGVKDAHMTEAILPFQRPIIAKNIDVKDWVIEKFDKATAGSKPYCFPGNYSYDPDDGLLTGTNDTSDWVMIGPGSYGAGNLYGIIDVDFEVTGGNWRVTKWAAIKVYAITKADGTDMGIEGIFSQNSDRTELEPGRYTMSYISFTANAFCDIAPGAKIKMHSMHQHTLHCVANINPRYYCNMQCWDDARGEWWTPLDINNHSTPVVPTFSDAAWRSVPAPALLSQPSFNGQLKIDDSGKVYVGVCVGANRTWKQINNT